MNKKSEAKAAMLKKLSSMMGDERNSGIGEGLKSKKVSKVTVVAPDKKSLAQGLSKAQQIIAAKGKGDFMTPDEHMDEALADHEFDDDCSHCNGAGCNECVDDIESY